MAIKKSRDPLFYIVQPTISFPEVKMQESFIAKKTDERPESLLQDVNERKEKEIDLIEVEEVENENEEHEEAQKNEGIQRKALENTALMPDKIQEAIHDYHEKQIEESVPSERPKTRPTQMLRRLKSFKEMNTEERLYYIENFPKQLPPVPCVFITKNHSIKGVLLNRTENMIEVKQMDHKVIEISMGDLADVKMIGFQ